MRSITRSALAGVLALGLAGSGATMALAAPKDPAQPKKVYVCKYVGKPGVDERLKPGKNPISVSVNSIEEYKNGKPVKIGDHFADGQELSVVVGFADNGAPAPECPATSTPETPAPTPEPTKPTTPEPTKPTTPEPTKPTTPEPTKPTAEPTKPSDKPSEPTKPSDKPSKPADKPSKPADKPSTPAKPDRGVHASTGVEPELPVAALALTGVVSAAVASGVALKRRH